MSGASNNTHKRLFLIGLGVLLVVLAFMSVGLGPVKIKFGQIIALFGSRLGWSAGTVDYAPFTEETLWSILWAVRMPRMLLAILVGAALAVAGAGMQGLFRNPLADPSLIGVSAGAAMGAVTVMVIGKNVLDLLPEWMEPLAIPLSAFIGGIGATFLVYHMSKVEGRTLVATMLLTGIAVNALAAAFIGLMMHMSDNRELRDFVFWSLGRLSDASWKNLGAIAPLVLAPLAVYPFYARALNAFLLGESEARHLGIDTQRAKMTIIFLCAAMVSATVAICGIIGFVGLVVPHLARLRVGPDHRYLLPASALLGGSLLLAADLIARMVNAPAELPIGVVTALLGAPFFMSLLYFSRHRVWA